MPVVFLHWRTILEARVPACYPVPVLPLGTWLAVVVPANWIFGFGWTWIQIDCRFGKRSFRITSPIRALRVIMTRWTVGRLHRPALYQHDCCDLDSATVRRDRGVQTKVGFYQVTRPAVYQADYGDALWRIWPPCLIMNMWTCKNYHDRAWGCIGNLCPSAGPSDNFPTHLPLREQAGCNRAKPLISGNMIARPLATVELALRQYQDLHAC